MPELLSSTPKADGFRMPGEFQQHSGCWMIWPERPDNWRLGAKPAQEAFAQVAEAIHPSDPVTVAVSEAQFTNARRRLSPGIRVVEMNTNDSWVRDTGPSFVVDGKGEKRAVDWKFNAWGGSFDGLYHPWDLDDAVAANIAAIEDVDRYRAPIVMEGGAFHVDGEGTLITTAECLLSNGRNPELSQSEIETMLQKYLGVEKVLWIPRGVFMDETTGHVDNLAHFCAPGLVALTWTDDKQDEQFERSNEALEFLAAQTDALGRPLTVVKFPAPGPLFMSAEEAATIQNSESGMERREGVRLAASYCNFYIGSARVVYPLLDKRHDSKAGALLAEMFPDRQIIGVPAREILLGGGNIHCITQQVPS